MGDRQKLHEMDVQIDGMHCASCEMLIERRLKKLPGVEKVTVSHASGRATIHYAGASTPSKKKMAEAIQQDGYTVCEVPKRSGARKYLEIGAITLILLGLYFLLKQFHLVPEISLSTNMSYGFVFVLGLIAAVSTCIAVTGGLLVAVAAKYAQSGSFAGKFKTPLAFNIGRLVSYTVLGGLLGLLGSYIKLSSFATGILTIVVSLVMVLLGLQLLDIFPWLRAIQPRMPKFLAHKIYSKAHEEKQGRKSMAAPFLFGASTFFLPCGFTQALQLYVLSTGSMLTGALTLFFFALGTMPALFSLGVVSSVAKGSFRTYFLKVAGVLVVIIGIASITSGLVLAGVTFSTAKADANDPNVKLVDGVQQVSMVIDGYSYRPAHFTIKKGIPVAWEIDSTKAAGCAQIITIPKLGLTEFLGTGKKTLTFTPTETGTLGFSCTMGMTTRGAAFTVID